SSPRSAMDLFPMKRINQRALWSGVVGGSLAVLVAVWLFWPRASEANPADSQESDEEAVLEAVPEVTTITPRQNLPTYIQVQEPPDVEPFFRADLAALVAGTIKYMPKAIGDKVKKGEVLVEIEAPDRVQDVLEKESTVENRKIELEVARK